MLKEALVKKLKNLDPLVMGLASGFGINKLISKGMAKNLVGKSKSIQGFGWRERRDLANIVHGKDVAKTQKRIERASKNVYEKGEYPGFQYDERLGGGLHLPKRLSNLKDGKIDISRKDKLLYNIGKYGPTGMAIKAPIAVGAGVAVNSSRPKRPAQLPDDMPGWKSLDKSASETYIKPKENTMLDNAEFQISFSDELHKIAKSGNHDEAVAFLKEGSAFTTGASKAWRAFKRFARNPVLKTQKKVQEGRSYLGGVRATYAPTRTGRIKGRSQQALGQDAAIAAEKRIKYKREAKIRNVSEAHAIKEMEAYKMDRVKKIRDKKKYEPLTIEREKGERWVRSKNLRAQKRIKDKNIAKAKLDEKKMELDKIKADAAALKDQSIFTRAGGALTSSGTPKSVKTVAGAAAIGVPAYAGYQLTMADKKKKDHSIFKFGGKVSE